MKLPCSQSNPGEVNGICDGFGTTQCAPPFLGKLELGLELGVGRVRGGGRLDTLFGSNIGMIRVRVRV
jgi:hypothetical protein